MLPSTRILRAVIAAIRPRGHGFDQPIDDDVLGDIQRFFPYLPWPLRLGLPLGLWLVELGPPLFARRWCRFTSMAPGEAAPPGGTPGPLPRGGRRGGRARARGSPPPAGWGAPRGPAARPPPPACATRVSTSSCSRRARSPRRIPSSPTPPP